MSHTTTSTAKGYVYPADTWRHIATILGFPSKCSLAAEYYEDACREIVSLATTIATFEPVRLYTRPEDVAKARALVANAASASNINVIPFQTNHLWVRDTGPVYVQSPGTSSRQRYAIDFRFSEWGKRESITEHERAADGLIWPVMSPEQRQENTDFGSRVIAADHEPSPVTAVESAICLEGGALVVDGEGTLLATESSILNENRNPGLSRAAVEAELQRLLGVDKIVWFPGCPNLDVTDVHADAELNFVRPGVVVLSRPHPSALRPWIQVYEDIREILDREVDARGRRLEVHIIDEPDPACLGPTESKDPATNYVNFYFVNGGLIVPQFGDTEKDRAALDTLQKLCPDRKVLGLPVRALPLAGGVIHCSTQPVIALRD
ncbi:peptidylarginine deiminase [Xylariales sp. PMI_506]|nr:peptidylarginine deiminase [Xylariales sp. PMI_506]